MLFDLLKIIFQANNQMILRLTLYLVDDTMFLIANVNICRALSNHIFSMCCFYILNLYRIFKHSVIFYKHLLFILSSWYSIVQKCLIGMVNYSEKVPPQDGAVSFQTNKNLKKFAVKCMICDELSTTLKHNSYHHNNL